MTDLYYAYEGNEECESCTFGDAVLTTDYRVFCICFMSHDKTKEDKCSCFILLESVEPKEDYPK